MNEPTGHVPASYHDAFKSRLAPTKYADPCEVARVESMNCLDRNGYDKSKCTKFFQAYRTCKATWMEQRRDDRANGRDAC